MKRKDEWCRELCTWNEISTRWHDVERSYSLSGTSRQRELDGENDWLGDLVRAATVTDVARCGVGESRLGLGPVRPAPARTHVTGSYLVCGISFVSRLLRASRLRHQPLQLTVQLSSHRRSWPCCLFISTRTFYRCSTVPFVLIKPVCVHFDLSDVYTHFVVPAGRISRHSLHCVASAPIVQENLFRWGSRHHWYMFPKVSF